MRALPALGGLAGLAGAVLHVAGGLKSTPAVAALPFDVTLAAALGLLALLPLLLAGHRWSLAPGLGPPLAACGGLWLWWAMAALWSPWSGGVADRLPDILLVGPAMVAAGLLIGGEAAARRVFLGAIVVAGLFVGASVAWGLATDSVVLGGRVGADPTRLRVAYQVAGLTIACAAGLAALRAGEARGWRRLAWAAALLALAAAVLLPGGRAAFWALGLTVAVVPALRWWLDGQPRAALLWLAAVPLAGAAVLTLLLLDPDRAGALATLERLLQGREGAGSARDLLWAEAWRWGGFWGLGPGGFPVAAGLGQARSWHPHNHAIEALVEGGAVGLALWLAAFGGAAVFLMARLRKVEPGRAASILALTLPMALTAMVSTDLGNRMAWFALGLALSLGVEARRV